MYITPSVRYDDSIDNDERMWQVMTTLTEDLNRVAEVLRSVTDHDVEVSLDSQSVYVNFGYRAALVVAPTFLPEGKRYATAVFEWDVTGGVEREHVLGDFTMEELPGRVRDFLAEQDRYERELEEAMQAYWEDA